MSRIATLARLTLVAVMTLPACAPTLDDADLAASRRPTVEAYFNYPGSRQIGGLDPEADDVLIQMIERANSTIDFAVMGFSRRPLVEALVRAHHRGVRLRFVGNARHMHGRVLGYEEMRDLEIPMQVGNQNHIMHDKFFVLDRRFVLTGTGNMTPTGFDRNDNNWVLIDSPLVAADFNEEFEQMLAGRFGYSKHRYENGNHYGVGDTGVEVYYTPQEDAAGRILQSIEEAKETVEFFIFAFTKDQVGSAFIAKHIEFERYNRCCDPDQSSALDADEAAMCRAHVVCEEVYRRRYVRGVIDRSQLHSNGPYHEVYRLLSYGLDLRNDGNDNSRQPGDYQAGGGRQHSKTLVIDGRRPTAAVVTGSFNWSSSATISNDETLLVLKSERIGAQYAEYFDHLWGQSKRFGENWIGDEQDTAIGDVVFNEIHWDGWNGDLDPTDFGGDLVSNDEFIELLNTTDRVIDLSMWTIAHQDDFVMGFFPGTIIGPYERFLIADHNVDPYDDRRPQNLGGAILNADFVMNTANDPRFLRFNLHLPRFALRLLDPRANEVDVAGDGIMPFFGGRTSVGGPLRSHSMERLHFDCAGQPDCEQIRNGANPASWQPCAAIEGGANIRDVYKARVIASPGEPNSGGEVFPDEDPTWRQPAP